MESQDSISRPVIMEQSIKELIEELTEYKTTSQNFIERKTDGKKLAELSFEDRILVERNDAAQKLFSFIILKLEKL
jgi:hypothetical protein